METYGLRKIPTVASAWDFYTHPHPPRSFSSQAKQKAHVSLSTRRICMFAPCLIFLQVEHMTQTNWANNKWLTQSNDLASQR